MISLRDYFEWLCSFVCDFRKRRDYEQLLFHLFSTQFTYILEMDANRVADGIDLRYRYGRDRGERDSVIASEIDIYPCNVLEMLVALSMRIENVMDNPESGDRTGKWFWIMMDNLSLSGMFGDFYDEKTVDESLSIFMDRRYRNDGSGGGLVVVEHPRYDMRYVEIWDQVNWYLSEHYI